MTEFIGKKISNNEYLYTNNGFKKTGLPNPDGTITSFVPTFDSLSAIPSGFVGTARVGTDLYVGDGIILVKIINASNPQVNYTNSSATPGNVTNNSPSGRAAIASGAASCVVTNSLVTATSKIFVQSESNDLNVASIYVSAVAAGSFTVSASGYGFLGNPTASYKFSFLVVN